MICFELMLKLLWSTSREGMIIDNDLIMITPLVGFYQQPVLSSALCQKLYNYRPLITTLNRDFSDTIIFH